MSSDLEYILWWSIHHSFDGFVFCLHRNDIQWHLFKVLQYIWFSMENAWLQVNDLSAQFLLKNLIYYFWSVLIIFNEHCIISVCNEFNRPSATCLYKFFNFIFPQGLFDLTFWGNKIWWCSITLKCLKQYTLINVSK